MSQTNKDTKTHLVLIGDSTLDNLVWVDTKEEAIPSQLRELLPNALITNYAADGFNSKDTLQGNYPSISAAARETAGDPFPVFQGTFKPLQQLKELHKRTPVSHVVLSVGGNDVREILGNLNYLPNIIHRFLSNYPKILEEIFEVTPKVIIMLQYRPAFNQDSYYRVYKAMKTIANDNPVSSLNALMQFIYPHVFQLARKHSLAIIDLPNTFDIYNDALYRSQIEPSSEGGKVICKLIKHVLEKHDFSASKFYKLKGDQVIDSLVGDDWQIEGGTSVLVQQMLNAMVNK
eukprot:TRINITY_DN12973_c0_g1_i1.p1 TRINITY_DN12973_c0_g1~~TRINITY_DN12973_c0_g1_i1.p1  ORF type:complete len:306 (+),score=31.49 TRINITY_DN12973_c0_g1_i1:53-919(+)